VIAVDTNVLVYAHREETTKHRQATDALVRLAEGDEPWGLPVLVLGEFLRVVTHPRLFSPPTPLQQARGVLHALLESPTARLLLPGPRFWSLLDRTLDEAAATGNLVFDAQIAALCREYGVTTLLSDDRDFRRFPSLKTTTL
jgi:toxin-antitoxin system PIN domain toxin